MTKFDKGLYLLGLTGSGYLTVTATQEFHGPKWIAVVAGLIAFVAPAFAAKVGIGKPPEAK